MTMMDEKANLRRAMKTKLKPLSPETFKIEGIEAGKYLIAESVWNEARTILLFMSMRGEIDTRFLLDAALSSGKNLFVPRINQDKMAFYQINTLDGPWNTGTFGILEPIIDNKRQFLLNNTDFPILIIVPGLAFDKNGGRLGRGKGYYDRFLSEIRKVSGKKRENVTIAGFCLAEQLIDHVFTEDFDQKMDAICAGNEYIQVR